MVNGGRGRWRWRVRFHGGVRFWVSRVDVGAAASRRMWKLKMGEEFRLTATAEGDVGGSARCSQWL